MHLLTPEQIQELVELQQRCDSYAIAGASPETVQRWLDSYPAWLGVQKAIGLQMGLFAYLEPAAEPSQGRNLVYYAQRGAHHPDLPYFGEAPDGNWNTSRNRKLKASAFSRARETEAEANLPVFFRAFGEGLHPALPSGQVSSWLTESERQGSFVFAPDGEMTACILGWWLRRILNLEIRDCIRMMKYDPDAPLGEVLIDPIEQGLADSWDPELRADYSRIHPTSLSSLFGRLGIRARSDSERFRNLVFWLRTCLSNSQPRPIESPPIAASFREIRLRHPAVERFFKATDALGKFGTDSIDDVLLSIAAILLEPPLSAEQWIQLCRFTLPGHFYLRESEEFERSWLVLPILKGEQTGAGYEGFFLGTMGRPPHIGREEWYSGRHDYLKDQIFCVRALLTGLSKYFNENIYGRLRDRHRGRQTLESVLRSQPDASVFVTAFADDTQPIISDNPKFRNFLENCLPEWAKTELPVLLTGDSGTGKGLIAQALHHNSPKRRNGPFKAINCSAIPETLLEAELFGYEKGSFTGAERAKQGLFELAHGGTLFLDEIGDMPLSMQVKLLHVLETKKILRIGSVKEIALDIRIVAATNRNIKDLVAEGSFRDDLYYRLDGLAYHLLPLRDRKEDLAPLAMHFMKKIDAKVRVDPSFFDKLRSGNWFGNVRQLSAYIDRVMINYVPGALVSAASAPDLPTEISTNQKSLANQHGNSALGLRMRAPGSTEETAQPSDPDACGNARTPGDHGKETAARLAELLLVFVNGTESSKAKAMAEVEAMRQKMGYRSGRKYNSEPMHCANCGAGHWPRVSPEVHEYLSAVAEPLRRSGTKPVGAVAGTFYLKAEDCGDGHPFYNWLKRYWAGSKV